VFFASLTVDLVVSTLHYVYHRSPWLHTWMHARHHLVKGSKVYSVLALSTDVSEMITYLATFYSALAIFHFTLGEFVIYAALYLFHTFVAHEPIELKGINVLLVDGVTHLQHHHFPTKNFGVMYTLWDKYLFNSFLSPYDRAAKVLSVPTNKMVTMLPSQ
jgi:hypothetical protein